MERVLIADLDKCTGCKVCELICSLFNQGECNPAKSYIWIAKNQNLDVNIPLLAVQCIPDCDKCVEFCPAKCLSFVQVPEAAVLRKGLKIGSIPVPLFSRSIS